MKNGKLESGDKFKVKFTTNVPRQQTTDANGNTLAVPTNYFQQNFVVVDSNGEKNEEVMNAIAKSGFLPRVRTPKDLTNYVGDVLAVFKGEDSPNGGVVNNNAFSLQGAMSPDQLVKSAETNVAIAAVNAEW